MSTPAGARHSKPCRSSKGWGVEFGLLVDLVDLFGRDAIAQVDLGTRRHRNKPLLELGPQALAILVTALRRADLVELDDAIAELVQPSAGGVDFVDVEVRERPPMSSIPEYRARFHHSPSRDTHHTT